MSTVSYTIKKRSGSKILIETNELGVDILEHFDIENNRYIHPTNRSELLEATQEKNLSKEYSTPSELFSDLFE